MIPCHPEIPRKRQSRGEKTDPRHAGTPIPDQHSANSLVLEAQTTLIAKEAPYRPVFQLHCVSYYMHHEVSGRKAEKRTTLKFLQESSQDTCRFAPSIVNNRPSIGPLIDGKRVHGRAHQFAQLHDDVVAHILAEPFVRCSVDCKRRWILCCVLQFASVRTG